MLTKQKLSFTLKYDVEYLTIRQSMMFVLNFCSYTVVENP